MISKRVLLRIAAASKSFPLVEMTSSTATWAGTAPILGRDTVNVVTVDTEFLGDIELLTSHAFWFWVWNVKKLGFNLSQLEHLYLSRETLSTGRPLTGCVQEWEANDDPHDLFYRMYVKVPGPFPTVEIHHDYVVILRDEEEALAWLLSHELYHYLVRTKQLSSENNEPLACAFADAWLETFKNQRATLELLPVLE